MPLQGGDDDRRRHRWKIQARNGSIASSSNKRNESPCSDDDGEDSRDNQILECLTRYIPEDIWRHIHSLLPLRHAARAACVSHAFLSSWRCLPRLIFDEISLKAKAHAHERDFSRTVDNILSNHSGIGVKVLKLQLPGIAHRSLDKWLQAAATPGIEELTVMLYRSETVYNFPCSLLSKGITDSVRLLKLGYCAFHPTTQLGTLRSLTSLYLDEVHIDDNELEDLLSHCPVLERLDLIHCDKITWLKLPPVMERLIHLKVGPCWRLQGIKNQAPNLSSLYISGKISRKISGKTSQVKSLVIFHSRRGVYHARAELPSIMPNLETLRIKSRVEVADTPMLPTKFLYLKHLNIVVASGTASPPYDYLSLVSFLDASPSLETLSLDLSWDNMKQHESVFEDSSPWSQMAEHHHCSLKSAEIIGFSSAKSLVELTYYILENAVSLECLTLDTVYGYRCSGKNDSRCSIITKDVLTEAPRALMAIRTHIEYKVPSRVKLNVVGPCNQCHIAPSGVWTADEPPDVVYCR